MPFQLIVSLNFEPYSQKYEDFWLLSKYLFHEREWNCYYPMMERNPLTTNHIEGKLQWLK